MWIFTLSEVGHLFPMLPVWLSCCLIFLQERPKCDWSLAGHKGQRARVCGGSVGDTGADIQSSSLSSLLAIFGPSVTVRACCTPDSWAQGPNQNKAAPHALVAWPRPSLQSAGHTIKRGRIFFCWASFLLLMCHLTLSWVAQWGEETLLKPDSKWLTWSLQMKRIRILTLSYL